MTLDDAFETAMVDAMNRFAREVLFASGFIVPEKWDEITSPDILRQKYVIARSWASKWASLVVERGLKPAEGIPSSEIAQSPQSPTATSP